MTRGIGSTNLEVDSPHKTPVYFASTDTTCHHSQASKDSSQCRTEGSDDNSDEKSNVQTGDDVEMGKGMTRMKRQPTTDLGLALTRSDGGPTYIEFGPDDPDDPVNWPTARKAIIAAVACLFSASTAVTGTGWGSLESGVIRDLGCSQTIFLLGNTLYLSVGISFTPLLRESVIVSSLWKLLQWLTR